MTPARAAGGRSGARVATTVDEDERARSRPAPPPAGHPPALAEAGAAPDRPREVQDEAARLLLLFATIAADQEELHQAQERLANFLTLLQAPGGPGRERSRVARECAAAAAQCRATLDRIEQPMREILHRLRTQAETGAPPTAAARARPKPGG